MSTPSGSAPLELRDVLGEEARCIHGHDLGPDQSLQATYRSLGELGSAALCLSGGGIRSAAFCLGAIQALASSDTARQATTPSITNTLLGKFHYLSTVSGGGYIGSWLSLWLNRDPSGVLAALRGRPRGPDTAPAELAWLRAYSNYLTPKLGLTSADTWANLALCVRNLVLNWFVTLPVLLLAVLAIKLLLVAMGTAAASPADAAWTYLGPALLAAALLLASTAAALHDRPSTGRSVLTQPLFMLRVLAPAVLSAYLFALAACTPSLLRDVGSWSRPKTLILGGAMFGLLYAASWIVARRRGHGWADLLAWTAGGVVHGGLAAFGLFALNHLDDFGALLLTLHVQGERAVALFVYGVPWLITAQLTAEMVFVGLTSYQLDSDEDREWFGRSAGWFTAVAVGWVALALLAVVAAHVLQYRHRRNLAIVTGLSGVLTALLGHSSLSPALEKARQFRKRLPNLILGIVSPLFMAALVVGASVVIDRLLLRHSLLDSPLMGGLPIPPPTRPQELFWLAIGLGSVLAVGVVASLTVNINRFSLHALYRNRLIRAFLGASNQHRTPNPFTGFDSGDNPAMSTLWRPGATWQPFHVINIALNIVSTRHLAWQERKAEPFTVSPLHAGSAFKSYRPVASYGGPGGMTLGTALAISGAAVSPNMGYHSSPGTSFLMALLNVRLGWWLGNPGPEGETTFGDDGPKIAVLPMLMEAFGLTTDRRKYVYLSDGGHFENLGLYEMVRRRCRHIVVIDAGCDPAYAFEDLGNALRKIALDLGIGIDLPGLEKLMPRGPDGRPPDPGGPFFAVGIIGYPQADGGGAPGRLLYIKPGYGGLEGALVRSYATANPAFPHQSTLDQWFSESQFESYRALGSDIVAGVLARSRAGLDPAKPLDLAGLFEGLAAPAR